MIWVTTMMMPETGDSVDFELYSPSECKLLMVCLFSREGFGFFVLTYSGFNLMVS